MTTANRNLPLLFWLSIITIALTACGGGGGGSAPTPTDPGGTADTTAPALLSQTPAARLLKTDIAISIHFDESIDTSSFTLSGNLATASDGGVWSQTDIIDDTLTITPTTSWPVNTGRTLVINAKDLAGNAMTELTITHDVYLGTLYYVNTAMLDDTGNGETPVTARKFIHTTVADVTAPATLLVAGGEYRLSSAAIHNTQVVLKEGVSLYGGYNADFTQRDPATYISRIVDHSADAGTNTLPNRTIEGDASITASTIVDGFSIQGSEQTGNDYSAAIVMITGAAATIQNNTIHGGSGATQSIGMYNHSSSPTVLNNTINGGSSSSGSIGMMNFFSSPTVQNNTLNGDNGGRSSTGMYNRTSSPTVLNNTINAGSGNQSYGINNLIFSSPTVQDNTIDGGSGGDTSTGMVNSQSSPTVLNNMLSGGSGRQTFGMRNANSSSPTVQDNTINGGSGDSTSISIFNSSSASPDVQNNILLTRAGTGSRCYFELNDTTDPTALKNNQFVACDVLYRDEGITNIIDIDEVNALADIGGGVSGNTYSATP